MAHPELAGNYVEPFTLSERLAHARQAEKQLGATIPWIVDAMDNRLKHALGDRPNSEYIVDPNGIIVHKRAWSHPAQVRKDLEQLVGPTEHITDEKDIVLKLELPKKAPAARGIVPILNRSELQSIVIKPKIEPKGAPFFAKLRAEVDNSLLTQGTGQLYVGFHLDPFHEAHWNNLTKPLSFKLDIPEGVKIDKLEASSPIVNAASDADPREFLLNVEAWTDDQPIHLTVTYFACVGEESCHSVRQEYDLYLKRDRDGGRARGEQAGFWDHTFLKQMLARDKNRDGKLNKAEVHGLVLPHFDHFDTDQDGLLSPKELKVVLDWLNYHHEPGARRTPETSPTK